MRQRIDISEVEAETKIRAKYLRALENEEWNLLPGPTYVKSFLRTYADALGLDGRLLVEEYKLRHERLSDIELQPIAPPRVRGGRRAAARPAARAAALAHRGPRRPGARRRPRGSSGAGARTTARPRRRRDARRRRARPPRRAARARRPPPSAGAGAAQRAAAARIVRLQVLPSGPVFVCLVDARGRQLDPRLDAAGRRRLADVPLVALPHQPGQQQRPAADQRAPARGPAVEQRDRLRDHAAARAHAAPAGAAPDLRVGRAHGRTGRRRRHRHRGPHGPRARPQRAVAQRAAHGARRRPRRHRRRGRPARRRRRGPALAGRRGDGRRADQRRPGPDRRRPDRGGRGRASRAGRCAWTRRSRGGSGGSSSRCASASATSTPTRCAPGRASRPSSRRAPRCSSPSAPRPASSSRPPRAATARSSSCSRGRRASCRGCGPRPRPSPAFRAAIAGATTYRERMLRLFGIPESEIAETLRVAAREGVDLDALEVTTCLRRGEVEVVTRWEPPADPVYERFEAVVRRRHADTLFSDDGSSVDEQVARLLLGRGWTIATAESCTGGLLAGRLTERAGSSRLRPGRPRRLRRRGQGRARGRRPGADRGPRGGVDRGRRGARRRRPLGARRRRRRGDHGRGRPRRGHGGEAGRDRLLLGRAPARATA